MNQLERLKKIPPLQLRGLLQRTFPTIHFGIGAYALNYFAVTSHNIGMLMEMTDMRVYDDDMLESALRVAKGDILALLQLLDRKKWITSANRCYSIVNVQQNIGSITVDIPKIAITNLLGFE